MSMALPGGLGPRMVSIVVMTIALLLAGCGGSTALQHDSTSADLPLATVELQDRSFPSLPDPGSIERDVSAIPSPLNCPAGSFRDDLVKQGVSPEGSGALFSPMLGSVPDPAGLAYAIYSFDLSVLDNPHAPFGIEVREQGPASDERRVYAAISDPERGRWQWVQLQQWPGEPVNMCFWGLKLPGEQEPSAETLGAMRHTPFQNIVILVTGTTEFHVESVAIRASDSPPAGGTLAFRKGWDGTVKGTGYASQMDVETDGSGRLHACYYDDSNGQLYHIWQDGRLWHTQAVDCEGDVGSSLDLAIRPDGGLVLAYYDATTNTGVVRQITADNLDSMVWSPRSNFEVGSDEIGTPIEAGANPSVAFDDDGFPHVFYECATTGRIRHAWKELGTFDWLHEYISPDGELEGQPIAFNTPYGVYCLTRKGWDGCIYGPDRKGTKVYEGRLIPADMHNPLDPESEQAFFDAVCRDSTAVLAMACTGGQRLVRFDLDSEEVVQDFIYNDSPGGGCFMDLAVMGDGSVRIADYNAVDRTIYFETGDIPTQPEFTFLPAVQYGEDEDCDGIAFWVDASPAAGTPRDALLVDLHSSPQFVKPGDGVKITKKKEFKGHVTLLK